MIIYSSIHSVEAWTTRNNNSNHNIRQQNTSTTTMGLQASRFSRRSLSSLSLSSSSLIPLLTFRSPLSLKKKRNKKNNKSMVAVQKTNNDDFDHFETTDNKRGSRLHQQSLLSTSRDDDQEINRREMIMISSSTTTTPTITTFVIAAFLLLGSIFCTVLSPADAYADAFVSSSSSVVVSSSSSPSVAPTSSSNSGTNTNTNSWEQNLMKSLKAPTEEQPQIQFPIGINTANNNDNKDQQYIVPIQISLEEALSSPSSVRPFKGYDVLVLQVWTDQPTTQAQAPSLALSSSFSSQDSTSAAADTSPLSLSVPPPPTTTGKIIGGSKIPISAIAGGKFPVQFSLGPINSMMNEGGEDQWKMYTSSNNLWVRASICRPNDATTTQTAITNTFVMNRPSSSFSCPTPDIFNPTPLIEGIGFSKLIRYTNLDSINNPNQQQEDDGNRGGEDGTHGGTGTGTGTKGGIRVPVTVVLSIKE